MKKFEDVIVSVDGYIDRSFGHLFARIAKHFSVFSSIILIVLLTLFVFKIIYHRPYYLASVIEQDLTRIADVLAHVDKKCSILSINGQRMPVNFLTVKQFVGSAVGGLNLAYPQKWEGPYLQTNPTHQQRFYEIVQTHDGIFLVPGDGVVLPNGLQMGRDIVLKYDASLKKMLSVGGELNHQGAIFGLELGIKIGDWDPRFGAKKSTIDKVNFFISEFNQAMPFTNNQVVEDFFE